MGTNSIKKMSKNKNNPRMMKSFAKKPKRKNPDPPSALNDIEVSDDPEMSSDSSDVEEGYEQQPRSMKTVKVRNLLPVKSKDKLFYRSEVVNEESAEEENQEEKPKEEERTLLQKYAGQQKLLKDLKCKVALLCTSVIEDPEKNTTALKELISMLQNPLTQMLLTEKRMLSLSLFHVFLDILPGYRIRQQEEKDTKVKLKKETRKLQGYEQNLLKCYKKFIDLLYDMVRAMKVVKSSRVPVAQQKVTVEVGLMALKCLCELLYTRFSFNHFKNIANKLVPLAIDGDIKVTSMCCQAFEKMFKADKLGQASFDLINQIVLVIKERNFEVPIPILQTFFCLNLREAKAEPQKVDMNKGRKEWKKMSRSGRKDKKKIKDLEAELKEAEAYESVETVKKFHTQTLNKIFWVFFHILKDGKKRDLIAPALEGLSKFAWLINLEFYDDLNSVLCSMMENGQLNDVEKLHGVYTLFTILAGQAESLHIDPHRIYCHMYEGLLKLNHFTDIEHYDLTLKCLDHNVIRKRNKISSNRILSFTKRMCTVCLQTPVHGTLALLSSAKNVLTNIKTADILLDSESSLGSGFFRPEVQDPEHCNVQSTALWELHLLKKHYNPIIKLYALHLLNKCPTHGRYALPEKLFKASPEETLHLFAEVAVKNKMDFLEETTQPPKKKIRLDCNTNLCYENDSNLNFDIEDVKGAVFYPNS